MQDLTQKFGIKEMGVNLFDSAKIKRVAPSDKLLSDLADAEFITLSTKKAVTERIIAPILVEVRKRNNDFQIFSGEIIEGDKKLGLNGEIDFVFAKTPITTKPKTPIFCVTESKLGRVTEAFPQATAQMIGVRLFNKNNNGHEETIHAIVTDGKTWRILRLEGNNVFIDQNDFSTENISLLLGVLQEIVNFYKKSPSILRG